MITLTFQLTVSDPDGLSSTDTCQVFIEAVAPTNQPPVAEAGPNQIVTCGDSVQLDGSASSDPEGKPFTCQWIQRGGPDVQLSTAGILRPTFTAPMIDNGQNITLIFELIVSDDQSQSGADTCLVQVIPVQPADTDGDGVIDDEDAFPNDPAEQMDTDQDGIGNNADSDDDNDGMPDVWESQYGLDPLYDDSTLDADQDGVSNIDEYTEGSNPSESDQNQPPLQPKLLYPMNNDNDVEDGAKLKASEFEDPDTADVHTQSEWLITTEQATDPVLQVIKEQGQLTWLRVPRLTLDPKTSYICQVRYFDDHGQSSEWSMPVTFTTQEAKNDHNKNGVSDEHDVSAATDINANNISDLQETRVIRSLIANDDQHLMAVDVEENGTSVSIDSAGIIDPLTLDNPPTEQDIDTYGLLTYRIQVEEPGQEITATIYLSGGVDGQTEWISQNAEGAWTNCTADIVMKNDGYRVVRILTDGGDGDADGVPNGTIIDIVGPVKTVDRRQPIDEYLEDSDPAVAPVIPETNLCFIGSLME
jgi:hypothetical protein